MNDDLSALAGFDGLARLFPLPNLVLFPQVVQGLHIFEPRYRQMTADALDTDKMIALVLLKKGWEQDYDGKPAIESVACLSRITQHERLPDGRYNLRVRGLVRLRLIQEIPPCKLYRIAQTETLSDKLDAEIARLVQLRKKLGEVVSRRFNEQSSIQKYLRELFASETPLGHLCDILAYALPLEIELKQHLLDETNVVARAEMLIHSLEGQRPPAPRSFPPDFSLN